MWCKCLCFSNSHLFSYVSFLCWSEVPWISWAWYRHLRTVSFLVIIFNDLLWMAIFGWMTDTASPLEEIFKQSFHYVEFVAGWATSQLALCWEHIKDPAMPTSPLPEINLPAVTAGWEGLINLSVKRSPSRPVWLLDPSGGSRAHLTNWHSLIISPAH